MPRTILDLAATLDPQALEKAIREAEFLRLFDLADLERLLNRYPRAKGSRRLRIVVARAADSRNRTRSELEDRFYDLLRESKIDLPLVNHTLHLQERVFELDMAWPDRRLVVELDGWQGHGTRSAFESDRQRDLALAAAGWTVVRLTWNSLRRGLPSDLCKLLTQ